MDPVLDDLLQRGKQVFLPRVEGNALVFYHVDTLVRCQSGTFGILEPPALPEKVLGACDSPCVALVPGLAFDWQGYRLGYGKGFYDRFFASKGIQGRMVRIGVVYEQMVLPTIHPGIHDVPMDFLLTQRGWHTIGS